VSIHSPNKARISRLSLIRHGIWWWADDPDNPFGFALLACPRISRTDKMGSLVYLYTMEEAVDWKYPKLIAREDCDSPLSKLGWVIHRGGDETNWTLPGRLHPSVTIKLIRKNIIHYNRVTKK